MVRAKAAIGLRIASLINLTMPSLSAMANAMMRSIGRITIALARSHAPAKVGDRDVLDEVLDVLHQPGADVLERLELRRRPVADLIEDAVGVERVGDELSAGNQLDRASQDVAGGARDPRR